MKNKIKYIVFSKRKNFKVLSWIESSSDKTYTSFCNYLKSINVIPPKEDYFNRALRFYTLSLPSTDSTEDNKTKEDSSVDKTSLDEVVDQLKETLPEKSLEKSKAKAKTKVIKEVKKPVRRKRRRKTAVVNNEN